MHHVIYVPRFNICFNAACGQTEEGQNLARGQMPSPLKVAQRATCARRKNLRRARPVAPRKSGEVIREWGEHFDCTFVYFRQGPHRWRPLCRWGHDFTAHLLQRGTAATYAGLISGGEDRHHLRHRAIRAKSAGQHLLYLWGRVQVATCNLSNEVYLKWVVRSPGSTQRNCWLVHVVK